MSITCRPASSAPRATSCSTGSTTTPSWPRRPSPTRRWPATRHACSATSCCATARPRRSCFCSVHADSVDALFAEAEKRNLRLIAGKVLMDRNAPAALTDTARSGYDQSKALIAKWHGRGRCLYAITPRYAAVAARRSSWSSRAACGASTPDDSCRPTSRRTVDEIAWVKKLFPQRRNYLDIYDHYGLIGRRARARSRRAPGRGRLRALPRDRHRARALSDLEPVSRQRPVSDARRRATLAVPSMSASARISAPGRASRCSRPWARPTRWRSCKAVRSTPSRLFFSLRSAAPARSRSTTALGTLAPGPGGRHGGARPECDAAARLPQSPLALDRARRWRCCRRSATTAPFARPMWRASLPMSGRG